jgi:hypothetical protein
VKGFNMEKKLLIENILLENINKTSLQESVEGTITNVVVFKDVKIWRLDSENLNGRIYPTALAERIVSEGRITFGYDNHPQDEFLMSFKDVKAIEKNPKIKEGFLVVDLHFVDTAFANKLETIIELGGKVGVSSVGYGILDENNVIDVNSYELVRYADTVINPSYQVYIGEENIQPEEQEEHVEEVQLEEEPQLEVETSTESEETPVSVCPISSEELENIKKRFEVIKQNGKH